MHPAVMVATVVTILLMLLLPRKYVVIPFLLCVFLVPWGQQIYVAGMHWYVALRILMLAGFVRLARAKFQVGGGLNGIDKAFILWATYRGVCQVLLFPQRGMVIYQAAFWLEAFGGYFLLRHVIQDEEDIARAAKTLAVLAVILGACMLNEHIHHVNVFGFLGGAPITPQVRDGQIRAQAIFGHPLLAGCFGATLVPLFYWLWKSGRSKLDRFSWSDRLDPHGFHLGHEYAGTRLRRRSGRFVSLAYSPVHARSPLGNRADARGTGGGDEGAGVVCDCTRQGD